MYAKLIFKNAKRSVKDYLIYIVTMTLCVTLFYAFLSISSTHYHPTIGAEYNISLLAGGMKLAICGISLLLLFLIHYVNRFMLRKKQSEFAVEATLGMEQKTIGLLFFGETFFLLIFSVSVGILLGMIVSQVITAMLLASFGEPYAFSWSFFPDTVLLTVGFFVICQILVGVGNVRILNKSRIIELMTANRQNEKPLHKSRWMPMICIIYGIMLLWMLEVGAVKYHFYFDPRHPLPVKLMYWGNVLFPALTLLWAIAGAVLHRKIGFSRYLCGLLAGAVLTAIPIFSIAELEKAYFLGFDAPTLNQYLLFGVADILFIISAVIYLSNAALLYWKESKVSRKYHNTSLFLFGQLSSKLATNTKTMTIICVTLSDYNHLREILGLSPVVMGNNEFLVHCDTWNYMDGIRQGLKQQPEITLNGRTLTIAETPILTEPMEQYQMAGTKGYVLVLPDEAASQLVGEKIRLAMKLEDGGYPELKSDLKQFLNSGKWQPELQSGQQLPEKVTMGVTVKAWGVANSLTGFTAISFSGLYLSIIFIILSCSVLAFEQLSAIDKNQKNYAVIDRLGVPGHRQASLIRRELSTVFLIPLLFPLLLTVLLITGAQFFFGEAILQQGLVPLYGLVTILLFCAIYLTYFGATMFLFKRVILRPEMR